MTHVHLLVLKFLEVPVDTDDTDLAIDTVLREYEDNGHNLSDEDFDKIVVSAQANNITRAGKVTKNDIIHQILQPCDIVDK